jgi:hypothetical protein
MSRVLLRATRAFGRFWVEFLFGDSLVLAPGTLAILGIAFALRHHGVVPVVVVPLLVALLIGATAFQGRRRSAASSPSMAEREQV